MRVLLLIATLLLCACPGYEDRHSGTYRQVISDAEMNTEPIEVEVFRYGHSMQAIVRFYAGGEAPFSEELRCAWSEPTTLRDDDSFEAQVEDRFSPIRLRGRFENDELSMALDQTRGNSPELMLERISDNPNATCGAIQPRSVVAKFGNLTSQNEFDSGEYEIQNPYFGWQWIAVQPIQTSTIAVWTAFTSELEFYSMSNKVTANGRGLSGQLNVIVEAPDEEYRTVSGETRYSLAHFIVVDDEADDDTFVSWDRDTEPIIASGVRGGTRVDAPSFVEAHNQFGRALFFVEGRLDELGRLRDIIELAEEETEDGGVRTVDPTEHFYIAEVYAEDERVVGLRIHPTSSLQIPVTVTTEYLEDEGLPLPRLFPLD